MKVLTAVRHARHRVVRALLDVLERADHLIGGDFAIVYGAPALLLEAALALAVQGVERQIFTLGCPVQLDGDADHAESDGAFPDGSRHSPGRRV